MDIHVISPDSPIAMMTVGQLKETITECLLAAGKLPNAEPVPELMDTAEVAKLTGYSKQTIYQLTSTRQIPFHRPAHGGRKIVFKRSEILEWMQACGIETIDSYCNEHMWKKRLK